MLSGSRHLPSFPQKATFVDQPNSSRVHAAMSEQHRTSARFAKKGYAQTRADDLPAEASLRPGNLTDCPKMSKGIECRRCAKKGDTEV